MRIEDPDGSVIYACDDQGDPRVINNVIPWGRRDELGIREALSHVEDLNGPLSSARGNEAESKVLPWGGKDVTGLKEVLPPIREFQNAESLTR